MTEKNGEKGQISCVYRSETYGKATILPQVDGPYRALEIASFISLAVDGNNSM